MIRIDPDWQGNVDYHELLFGASLSYIYLVLMWEKVLLRDEARLEEWRYLLIHLSGASAFLVNHWFLRSPYYWGVLGVIAVYSYVFCAVWFLLLVRPAASLRRTRAKPSLLSNKALQTATVLPYTLVFIAFEYAARKGVQDLGMSEFYIVLMSFLIFAFVIVWRGNWHTDYVRQATGKPQIDKQT